MCKTTKEKVIWLDHSFNIYQAHVIQYSVRCHVLTSSEVDDNINEENSVWQAVKCDPPSWKIVVEEGYGNGKDNKVGNQ